MSSVSKHSKPMALQLQSELNERLAALSNSWGGELPLDDAVIEALPEGTVAQTACCYVLSAAAWSFTAKIDAVNSSGVATPIFLKYVAGDLGKAQLEGEYTGMSDLHRLAPNLVPRPIAWGKLKNSVLTTYFALIEFKQFVPGLPDPAKLGARLAAMHAKSASPNGKFGFHLQTYDGARIQAVGWDDSWTSFFSKLLAEAYHQDTETNRLWKELDISEGRKLTPVLIHGDLWDGNIANDSENGDPWIFDCAAYYAHNEMELGIWRAERHQMRAEVFREEYLRNFKASEPKNEWDGRNRLYSAKTNFMHSACFAGSPARRLAFSDMAQLVQKYVPWDRDSPELAAVLQAKESYRP
ncbi:Uu.00g035450.m01.CDS01 [Anthostomella pinea]|uniref:protein-ribulosamine 3-kinase n=1 Tax=Anthostomella pinea TaxID=933095 RepID=A0AAI8V9R8_9PEZI|nr:Uu.00g035450.m01.CDS01 [Anthostomella pinea]